MINRLETSLSSDKHVLYLKSNQMQYLIHESWHSGDIWWSQDCDVTDQMAYTLTYILYKTDGRQIKGKETTT